MSDLISISADLCEAARRSDGPLSQLDDKGRQVILERYRRFMLLCKKYPESNIAPTTDIDEMWHVHMLCPVAYFNDCREYFGGILDHNAGFGAEPSELSQLQAIFDATATLWADNFGESYIPDSNEAAIRTCFKSAIKTCFNPAMKTCFKVAIKTCFKVGIKTCIK